MPVSYRNLSSCSRVQCFGFRIDVFEWTFTDDIRHGPYGFAGEEDHSEYLWYIHVSSHGLLSRHPNATVSVSVSVGVDMSGSVSI